MPDDPSSEASPRIVVLVRDLMFSSKIRATAQSAGVAIKSLRNPTDVPTAGGEKLIVDLNQEGTIEAAQQWKQATGGTVTGFVSHVDTEAIANARAAGLDQVMARSAFVNALPGLLTE